MDVFNLFARLSLDSSDYESGLDSAGSKADSLGSRIGSGLATVGKITVGALAAATGAVAALTTSAVSSYAQYEQLVGGVETLFKDSADTLMGYAENAYKTAGLSTNQYMELATSFAASLIDSLEGDTEEAVRLADMAISDMSDNVNKMGSSVESVQNAYNGFAKGNFTMLDNLKLGYGGTKEEMQRLLEKAEELQAAQGNYVEYSIDSYADIVQAIHVVQEEMGIFGTTSAEAEKTVSGSLSSVRAAWDNLVTGFANGSADLDSLINILVESATTAFENLTPVIESALGGIATAAEKIAPIISEKLPQVVSETLPSLLKAATELVLGLINALPSIIQVLLDQAPIIIDQLVSVFMELLPLIVDLGLQVIASLATGIGESLPELIPSIVEVVLSIANTLIDNIDMLVDAALELITGLATGIINALPVLVEKAPEIILRLVGSLIENAPKLIEAAAEIIVSLANGLIESLPSLVAILPEIVVTILTGIVENAPKLLVAGVEIIANIVEGIGNNFSKLLSRGGEIIDKIKDGIMSKINAAKNWGRDLIDNFIDGIKSMWSNLTSTVSSVANTVKEFLGFSEPDKGPLSDFHTYAPDMMKLFARGIKDNEKLITSQIESSFNLSPYINPIDTGRISYGRGETGNITYNFYSPKAIDEVSASREMQKARQQMAMGYV